MERLANCHGASPGPREDVWPDLIMLFERRTRTAHHPLALVALRNCRRARAAALGLGGAGGGQLAALDGSQVPRGRAARVTATRPPVAMPGGGWPERCRGSGGPQAGAPCEVSETGHAAQPEAQAPQLARAGGSATRIVDMLAEKNLRAAPQPQREREIEAASTRMLSLRSRGRAVGTGEPGALRARLIGRRARF